MGWTRTRYWPEKVDNTRERPAHGRCREREIVANHEIRHIVDRCALRVLISGAEEWRVIREALKLGRIAERLDRGDPVSIYSAIQEVPNITTKAEFGRKLGDTNRDAPGSPPC